MSQSQSDRAALMEEFKMLPRIDRRRKLSLEGQCTVYACLYQGIHYSIVAEAFGVTRATVSAIGGCRDDEREPVIMEVGGHTEKLYTNCLAKRRDPDRHRRYQDVAQEFERLGEDEFFRRYFTDDVVDLMRTAKARMKHSDATHAGVHHFYEYEPEHIFIDRYDNGWAYAGCKIDGSMIHDHFAWTKDDNHNPFKTSEAAYKHAKKTYKGD